MLRNALPIGLTISVAGCSVRRDMEVNVITSSESLSTTSTIVGEDYLDYGEKLLRPGELLHLPTVKTAARLATETSYIVARVSEECILRFVKKFTNVLFITACELPGKRLVVHNGNSSTATGVWRVDVQCVRFGGDYVTAARR